MPFFPMNLEASGSSARDAVSESMSTSPPLRPPASVQMKNRRKRYLDQHPEYFSADLEMAGPRTLSSFCT